METIINEIIDVHKENINEIIKIVFDEKYNFLFINFDSNYLFKLFKNWDEIIFSDNI